MELNTKLLKSTIKGWALRIQYLIEEYSMSEETEFKYINQLQGIVEEMRDFSGE